MSKSFRRSSYQRASDVTDDTHRAATEHALAEQIALATSWAVHIGLLDPQARRGEGDRQAIADASRRW
jgi:predicted short-subunit dehydrogenase-like oxidoreductase (DUF2520 family)